MNVFELYESAQAFTRRNPRIGEVQVNLRAAEMAVIDAAGGINSKWLSPHMRGVLHVSVSATDNVAVLPDGAGPIIHGGIFDIDGERWAVLTEEESTLAGQGSLYSRSVVRNGNTLTFYGIPAKTVKKIAVVYSSSFRAVYMIDGAFMKELAGSGGLAGKNTKQYEITRPDGLVFPNGYLENSLVRIYSSDVIAKDFEVLTNTTSKDNKTRLVTSTIPVEVSSVSIASFRTEGTDIAKEYPAKIGRCMIPSRLRPAILEHFKYLESKDQKYLQSMLTLVQEFKRDN